MAWDTSDRSSRLPRNWATIRTHILDRDGWLCQLRYEGCTRVASEVDHIIAGDNHHPTNLQAACTRCHARKSATEGAQARAHRHAARYRPPEPHPGLLD